MASSDDEGDTVPNDVSDYKFVDGVDEESVSFANLPVDWSKGETHDGKQHQIYLSGKADNGLRKIYIQVTAWKFDLPKGKPEISVLSAQGNWIKLLKPWNPFNDIIRTVLVTLHVLHFAKWNPLRPQKALWDNLKNTLSMFERRPCVDDLADHVPLITEAIKWDEKLVKSKLLITFLAEKPWEKKASNENAKPPFIDDDINEKEDGGESDKADENEDSDSEEDDCFDSVCAICDNGGTLYICDGKCMRSFHATVEDGDDSKCRSLNLTDAELEAIKNVPFICENCKYKKHQCFACGKLGSSDELSNPEVFCCVNGACGYFYHPHCVSRLFHPGDNAAAEELQKRIAGGEPFACPIHRCHVCDELEVRSNEDMQFAVCRRCPKAYHRKCLPREITSEDDAQEITSDDDDADIQNGLVQRAWEGLIPNRILIYCLAHKIDATISTPSRDHIEFPGLQRGKRRVLEVEFDKNKNLSKGRVLASEDDAGNKISGKQQKANDKVLSISKEGGLSRKRLEELPTCPSLKKQKLAATRNSCEKLRESTNDVGGVSSGDRSYAGFCGMESEPVNSRRVATGHGENVITKVNPTAKRTDSTLTLDADARRRVLTLMKEASSSVTLEEVRKRHKPPSTHSQYSKFSADHITLGKVEGSIQAVRAALKKLDGGSVQDAKALCGSDLLEQVSKWKDKLKVYLAPFLYGMRYTSFGRHFTKMDKLKEIVELLHWYAQDGDMLVDFCCGSNDFSWLMKKKLDEMGKRCSFKNYDILQAKNDFNFERRDWMVVKKGELPDGSKLIMGLNPPFGVNAALANKFINKALEFKPKLLILIVPRETQRLDEKRPPYDLIWDDDQMLAGKSFYLPGSVDVNDKQIEDWNVNAPVLYLWSCPDWTPKHRAIAEQHSHLSGALKNHSLDESRNELHAPKSAPAFDNKSSARDEANHADTPKNLEQKGKESMSHQEGLPRDNNGTEAGKNHTAVKNQLEPSSKNSGWKGNKRRPPSNVFLKDKSSSKFPVSRHRSLDVGNHLETHPTEHLETPTQVRYGRGDYHHHHQQQQFNQSTYQSYSPTECTGNDERGNYQQLNQSNVSAFPPHSRTEHNGNDGMNDSETSQIRHHETPRQVYSGRGDYHPQQQFNQSNIVPYQPYSPTGGNDGMNELVEKYTVNRPHGVTDRQPYDRRLNPDLAFVAASDRQIGSPFGSYAPDRAFGGASGRQIGSPFGSYPGEMDDLNRNVHGRVQPNHHWNQGTAYPQRNIAGNSSYGGLNTSVTQLYASRLDETNHAPMGNAMMSPMVGRGQRPVAAQPPYQASLSFATGPFHPQYPHHNSSGWLQE